MDSKENIKELGSLGYQNQLMTTRWVHLLNRGINNNNNSKALSQLFGVRYMNPFVPLSSIKGQKRLHTSAEQRQVIIKKGLRLFW